MTCNNPNNLDAVVLGAGTAGSAAALFLARKGLRVALLEQKALDEAGACWVNGVPGSFFDLAGLDPPTPPERRKSSDGSIFYIDDDRMTKIDRGPLLSVDMRLLNQRLHRMAYQAGVQMLDRTRLEEIDSSSGRPRSLVCRRVSADREERHVLRAPLFVDATGNTTVLRRYVPELGRFCPAMGPEHLCSARQQICRIADMEKARAFLASHEAQAGRSLCWMGVAGGYSTLMATLDIENEEVDLLAGTMPFLGHATGPELMAGFMRQNPWIGEVKTGGQDLIPVRHAYHRPFSSGAVLLGNAGSQVFPAHGSGVGSSLLAARLLADTVPRFADPGSMEAVWSYGAAYQRTFGGVAAAYDVFRRFSQRLNKNDIRRLLLSGLLDETSITAALTQTLPVPEAGRITMRIRSALKAFDLLPRLLGPVSAMAACMGLFSLYPETPNDRALRIWSHAVARIFGDPPDVP